MKPPQLISNPLSYNLMTKLRYHFTSGTYHIPSDLLIPFIYGKNAKPRTITYGAGYL